MAGGFPTSSYLQHRMHTVYQAGDGKARGDPGYSSRAYVWGTKRISWSFFHRFIAGRDSVGPTRHGDVVTHLLEVPTS
jgi:hypothetical protein